MASAKDNKNKLAFLSMPAPASYVAGLGRGASGFTTRSDIGPAREGPSEEVIAEARAKRGEEAEVDPEQFQDPDNEYGLFAGMTYEADDEEADKIYEKVDEAMDMRRKVRREAREQELLSQHRAERPKIQQQFADLKRGLSQVTDAEWESIPEVGNLTRRKRQRGNERTYVVPDSVIVGDRGKGEYESSLDPMQQKTGGLATPADGAMTNFVEIGQARDKILSLKLDQATNGSVSSSSAFASGTSTSIDPKGYLTSLDTHASTIKSEAEIGDIKRARMLFDSLVKSNPKHGPGWIAAACLEEHAGRMVAARKIIKKGCEECPRSEDVWLEAARLHNNDDAKVILANAVQHVGQSVKIWLAAADLEHDVKAKKRVLRKALEHIPTSVRLWKETVNLESSPSDARILLARAVEVIPSSVELWLALARLETPEKAKAVLNKARKAVPTSCEIWIAAGRLLEQEVSRGEVKKEEGVEESEEERKKREKMLLAVDKTVETGVRELRKHGVLLTREQWIAQAEKCEAEGSLRTAEAIVKATMAIGLDEHGEEDEKYDIWVGDAQASESRGAIGTARAIFAYALKVFPHRSALWRLAAALEKAHGTPASLIALLETAVSYCPTAEVLWLMLAKEMWVGLGDVRGARGVLERAFAANSESESVWLAAVKLESESGGEKGGEVNVARELLGRARSIAGTQRIWMKSAVFERQQGNYDVALSTVSEAIKQFPKFDKLYMIQGQIYHEHKNNIPAARSAYANGLRAVPKSPTLWILASRLEEADEKSIKARALLEKGRLANPGEERLWAEAVRVEERAGGGAGNAQAKALLARALQECPASGLLWSMAVWAEPRPARKGRSVDALKKSAEDGRIVCTVARLFWGERKVEKAREWFRRAVHAEVGEVGRGLWGDGWGWWLKFERAYGTEEHREVVRALCAATEPRYGEVWAAVSKDDRNRGVGVRGVLELVADKLES
ncbi:PRP1 splicing factor, N-terminal-domain-containing protein [Ephemerocybe angulata]|uniref:PRP1 splicing factor, N-terminal-domain-containing protein n=1 Tax=Ephemerocybe angulata TaxID=980116 RepID=A0A8H6I1S2_9AGAR|nr:PRP1 splicing factor, N-terminal-domain-containing protein [Tulosesus angulatus]